MKRFACWVTGIGLFLVVVDVAASIARINIRHDYDHQRLVESILLVTQPRMAFFWAGVVLLAVCAIADAIRHVRGAQDGPQVRSR